MYLIFCHSFSSSFNPVKQYSTKTFVIIIEMWHVCLGYLISHVKVCVHNLNTQTSLQELIK